jgi:apolipoprotein N-acyltransferase
VAYQLLGLALASGAMLWLCHFPVAWSWLAWVALVPLLALVRAEARPRWLFLCAWLGGSLYYWPAISWMTVADTRMVACWALLSFYCSLYFPLVIFLVRRLERCTPLPLFVTFPAVWTALEFFRSWFGTGFSWYLLAHTQHNALHVIQIADLGGAFAVSFLVATVNVVLFEAATRLTFMRRVLGVPELQPERCCQGLAIQLGVLVVLLGGTLAYGALCLSHDEFETGPRVALLQANLDQRLRLAAEQSEQAKDQVHAAYDNLCKQASLQNPQPALIVWPETSYPYKWITVAPGIELSKQTAKFRQGLAQDQETVRAAGPAAKTHVLLGLNTLVLDYAKKPQRYNSALLLDSQGNDVLRYDKIHRVPFGEYVPFRDWLPFMNAFAPYDFDYSIGCGDGLKRFTLDKYHFGVLICYEDTDPFMARDYGVTTADGPAVDFLLNISNDGWFDGSSEHEEHLAISRFRAIETRRALARSVNMGISAVVDSNGRVLAPVKTPSAYGQYDIWAIPSKGQSGLPVDEWKPYKQVDGILTVDVPIDRRTSLYASCGDWLPYSCWVLIGGGLAWGWWPLGRRRTRIS